MTSWTVKKRKRAFKKENSYSKRKVAYVKYEESEEDDFDHDEVHVAELKNGPPYVCPSLKPIKGKEKINSAKSYSFNIIKAEQIFDVLLKEKQIILFEGKKMPSINELKG